MNFVRLTGFKIEIQKKLSLILLEILPIFPCKMKKNNLSND